MPSAPRADLPVPHRRGTTGIQPDDAVPLAPDTGPVFEPPPPRRNRVDRGMRSDLGLVAFLIVAAAVGVVAWNLAGGVTQRILHPPVSPAGIAAAATATPSATDLPPASPGASASPDASPIASTTPAPTTAPKPAPKPARRAI